MEGLGEGAKPLPFGLAGQGREGGVPPLPQLGLGGGVGLLPPKPAKPHKEGGGGDPPPPQLGLGGGVGLLPPPNRLTLEGRGEETSPTSNSDWRGTSPSHRLMPPPSPHGPRGPLGFRPWGETSSSTAPWPTTTLVGLLILFLYLIK